MPTDSLHSTFRAIADPTRRAILARLASGGEASVKELAEPFEMTLPAVSKHLKVLERAGLISRGREAQSRPCRLEAGPLRSTASTCTTSAMGTALRSCCSMARSAPWRAASQGCRRSSRATDGKTLMTMVQRGFPSAELRDEHRAGLPNAFAL